MKNIKTICILSFLWIATSYAQYSGGNNDGHAVNTITFNFSTVSETYIPDDNFELALYNLGYDNNAVPDNYVPTANIVGLLNLDLTNEGISDLTGIEDFIALTTLNISNNNLNTINLSKNTNLTSLTCFNNSLNDLNLTQNTLLGSLNFSGNSISSINLSQNNMLTNLICGDNNLTSLDTSNLTNLEVLECTNNQLTSLNLANNSVLNKLFCGSNNLTSLNIKNGNNLNIAGVNFSALANNLTCIEVDNVNYCTTNWTSIDVSTSFYTNCNSVAINIKVFLQGAYINYSIGEEMWMRDNLRTNNLIPTTSPYADALTCNASVFTPTGANAIVDWVWVELRDKNNNATILDGKSALLQRNGNVISADGISPITFFIADDNYFIAISHRNHLGILSANSIALSSSLITFDTSNNNVNVAGGSNAVATLGNGFYGLFAGDYDGNGQIQNTDLTLITPLLGQASSYSNADLDMNAQVQNTDINNLLNPNKGRGQQYAKQQQLKLFAKRKP